ncbi:ammonium transporter [Vibrio variabilis]|uniref:Ammonium transporter n=1 Tax=Vibrio variabilis TaxID=990271 RepID=A0ABQ0J9V0_9VIBR|nr:ammonium transporter [Vibrio variabilis]
MTPSVEHVHGAVQTLTQSSDTLFLLLGAIMVFLMHAGFAFLEVGTVRHKTK